MSQVTQYKYTLCNKNIHYRELRPNIHIRKISNGLAKFCFLKRYEFSKTSHVILKKRNRTHGDTKNEQNDIQWPCEYKFSYSFPPKCFTKLTNHQIYNSQINFYTIMRINCILSTLETYY